MLSRVGSQFGSLKSNIAPQTTTPSPAQSKIDYLRSKGLHVDPVNIKVLELSKKWDDNKNYASLSLIKAYLTPTLVENYTQYGNSIQIGKDIVVLEAVIRDIRIKGNPREIKFQDYFRLRENQGDFSPVGYLYSWLPQENQTIYVVFPVDPGKNQFKLMIGPFTNPSILDLDFSTAQEIKGVFNGFDGGFSPKFNENSKLIGGY